MLNRIFYKRPSKVNVPRAELRDPEAALDRAKRRAAAREALRAACARRPEHIVDELEAVLSQARAANIPSSELLEASAALELARRRAAARETLRTACERQPEPVVEELEAALSQSREATIPTQELDGCIAALEIAKLRVAAREALRVACARKEPSVDELRTALDNAREVTIPNCEMQDARAARSY